MKLTSILALCALAFFLNACEQHPTPGEAPVTDHAEAGKHEAKAEGAAESAKPAEGAKAEEKPQFFPDKAEKK